MALKNRLDRLERFVGVKEDNVINYMEVLPLNWCDVIRLDVKEIRRDGKLRYKKTTFVFAAGVDHQPQQAGNRLSDAEVAAAKEHLLKL